MEDFKCGNQCEFEGCKQLDYLNYFCKNCEKNYCKEHYHNEYNCSYKSTYTVELEKEFKKADIELITCFFCNIQSIKVKCAECLFCKQWFCWDHKIESNHNCKEDGKIGKKEKAKVRKNEFMERLNKLKEKHNN